MELIWIPISVMAALMQAVRTAAQKSLNERLSVIVTTYVRSIYGLPVMIVYLAVVMLWTGEARPALHAEFLGHCTGAAISQVAATVFLIQLFTLRNFAVGTTLTKTDVMMTAIIGSVLFSESIDALGWIAIALTVAGVIIISVARAGVRAFTASRDASGLAAAKPTIIGLASGLGFCFSYLFLREASLSLDSGGFLVRAGWTVVTVTTIQVVVLGAWLMAREPQGLRDMLPAWKACGFIGLTSAVGSICWFTAMTIENASYVKSVGQVETIFTLAISYVYFKERFNAAELIGIAVIVAGVLMFLL